ncbi:MAG: hypothetical protein AUK44_03285 [Porphyromonadaceae bacterium CG2_30_38_12]|nr:MAG: hypothetical protein AUK44_03285 [Porphyromonadaceae bacterium CG2_30_38_12]
MKKKNKKENILKTIELISALKRNLDQLKETNQDVSIIKTLESSVRKIEKTAKEIEALKVKLNDKKTFLKQESELNIKLTKATKKLLNDKPTKQEKSDKKEKKEKKNTVGKVENIDDNLEITK